MDFDQVDRDLSFEFGTKDYRGITIKRSLLLSGSVNKTPSHTAMLKKIKSGNEQIQVAYSTFVKTNTIPHASICLFHGLGEHSQRYNAMCWFFANEGYEIHTVDFRPYGRSGGPRGHVYSVGEIHEDIIACLKKASHELP
jgi:acylglycerol lipase